jgi:hypothetical protein
MKNADCFLCRSDGAWIVLFGQGHKHVAAYGAPALNRHKRS